MKKFSKLAYQNAIKLILPWVATAVTALPYSDRKSRFLDRLTDFVETNGF